MGEKNRGLKGGDDFLISGVGVQCHFPTSEIGSKRFRTLADLHFPSKRSKGVDFWGEMGVIREKSYARWFPKGGKCLVVVATKNTKCLDTETLGLIEQEMIRKGFFGWMTPEGILVLRKTRKPGIFHKACRYLNFSFLED